MTGIPAPGEPELPRPRFGESPVSPPWAAGTVGPAPACPVSEGRRPPRSWARPLRQAWIYRFKRLKCSLRIDFFSPPFSPSRLLPENLMGQPRFSRPVNPAALAEEVDHPPADAGMGVDVLESGDTTPPTKRKSKFSSFGKIFKPWKWRKKKSSDKFKETSEVLERKISMRKPREELVKRGVLLEDPEQDDSSSHSGPELEPLQEPYVPRQHLLPPKRPPSTSQEANEVQDKDPTPANSTAKTAPSTAAPVMAKPVGSTAAPSPAPRTLPPALTSANTTAPTSTTSTAPAKQPPVPPPKPVNRNSSSVIVPCLSPPPAEGSHRAHSLLFENDGFGEDNGTLGRTRSLPVTIEMLKVPDDEEEEEDDREEEQSSGPRVYIGDVPSVTVIPKLVPQVLPEEQEGDEGMSDSDSEGPILYKDDEDEEEDESHNSTLANKVKRKDTLAMKLGTAAAPQEEKVVFPRKSKEEWNEIRHQIGTTLIRRLSQRPTAEELEQRNILQPKNEADRQAEKREIKRRLTRKLSQRPTVAELQARKILRFNEYVEVTDAQDYDRRADKPWTKLTPADKAAIRKELNEFKSCEMEVHEDSKQFTRYHRP
ncbi:hypothetical protein Q9233_012524 [Columba guinea]|nr:hypothetical protein Q9233_012524 [Columba guinea]